jgi:hypothetical protein
MPQQHKLSKYNTSVKSINGETVVTLHHTDVVRFNDREITLDNGGWCTTTTATRMNQASSQFGLGFRVSRKAKEMFVQVEEANGWGKPQAFNGSTITFAR